MDPIGTILAFLSTGSPTALLILTVFGQLAHQFKKWLRDDTSGLGFFSFIAAHPKHTIAAIAASITAVYFLSQLGTPTIPEAVLAGYGADSMANKSPNANDYGNDYHLTYPDDPYTGEELKNTDDSFADYDDNLFRPEDVNLDEYV